MKNSLVLEKISCFPVSITIFTDGSVQDAGARYIGKVILQDHFSSFRCIVSFKSSDDLSAVIQRVVKGYNKYVPLGYFLEWNGDGLVFGRHHH